MTIPLPLVPGLAEAAQNAAAQAGAAVDPTFMDFPLGEAVVGAVAMAGLFVLFGLRAPAERSGGCGSCSGDCGSCSLDGEDCV